MPPKRFKRKNKRNGLRSTTQNVIVASGHEHLCSAEVAWASGTLAGQPGTSTGNLGNFTASSQDPQLVTGNNGSFWPLNPGQMGRRVKALAAEYSMYQVRRLVIHYIPAIHASPVINNPATNAFVVGSLSVNNPASGNTAATNTEMAFGFQRDPTMGPLNFTEVLQSGGKIVDTRRKFSFPIRFRSPWFYNGVFQTPELLTAPELRQEFFGQICSSWRNFCPYVNDVTTTGVSRVAIGDYWLEWQLAFKFPVDPGGDNPPQRSLAVQATQRAIHSFSPDPTTAMGPKSPSTPFEEIKSPEGADEDEKALERSILAVYKSNKTLPRKK